MIIKIEACKNGAHANQSSIPRIVPEGWAVVPSHIKIPDTFPFVDIEVKNGMVLSMTARENLDDQLLDFVPSPIKQRGQIYNTEKIIEFNGSTYTVTEASTLWQYYAAEGNEKATELTALIAKAKEEIRTKYPDIK